jgi:tRNA (guanine37-N1)-methyltransferase
MKIDILTLFPNLIKEYLNESIIKRAIDNNNVEINLINFRDYTPLNNNQVDDTIYGGGPGMLIRCEPIFECLDTLDTSDATVILLTPDGKTYNQSMARELALKKHLIIICGHYEGFDERIRTLVDLELSIGDFVMTGGEAAALCVVDSVVRLIPGVINEESLKDESFNNNLLDYPVYTKPAEYRGLKVPDVLISGDHKKIDEWRKAEQIKRTEERRPDLLK